MLCSPGICRHVSPFTSTFYLCGGQHVKPPSHGSGLVGIRAGRPLHRRLVVSGPQVEQLRLGVPGLAREAIGVGHRPTGQRHAEGILGVAGGYVASGVVKLVHDSRPAVIAVVAFEAARMSRRRIGPSGMAWNSVLEIKVEADGCLYSLAQGWVF